MTDDDDTDEHESSWFVATDLDDPDGWLFCPPPRFTEAYRRLASSEPRLAALSTLEETPIADDDLAAMCESLAVDLDTPLEPGQLVLVWAVVERAQEAMLRRVRATRRGGFRLRFGPLDRAILGAALDRLDAMMESDDPSLARLFPNPYPDDPELAAGWKAMVTDELFEKRRAGLALVRQMMRRTTATEDEVLQLMRTLNDTRLVLGTYFDVSEDERIDVPRGHPDRVLADAYDYLGFLVSSIISAIRRSPR